MKKNIFKMLVLLTCLIESESVNSQNVMKDTLNITSYYIDANIKALEGEKRIIRLIKSYINHYNKKLLENYLPNQHNSNITWEMLFVSIEDQTLYHIKRKNSIEKIFNSYTISSSEYGTGNTSGSNRTPLGLHVIKKKFGDQIPINGRMIGREFTGQIAEIYSDKTKSKTDDITSRILWISGIEKGKNNGKNIDSFKRYIYIHGTSEEGRLGAPASHGCIRMKNKDVIELYEKIKIGTLVLIL